MCVSGFPLQMKTRYLYILQAATRNWPPSGECPLCLCLPLILKWIFLSLNLKGWPLPQVMDDICLICYTGTSALIVKVDVLLK